MKKTAIILGATGLTGSYLLKLLLTSENYEKVKIFTRKSTGIKHPKLDEITGDILHLEKYSKDFKADEVFVVLVQLKLKHLIKKNILLLIMVYLLMLLNYVYKTTFLLLA
ncbi:NAD-dependent epimerase/dehydratase family protein [Flavobacterium oreochromis]|uniref:NAD-dependent epimerase/dehydratase family protein n=1 Tax=Flavobacterium oreochromis TaxID=2906078 RepID=UPI0021645950|nr:NAD-dependent epimerase/dehydratase family protein [Flavobacterium oreochromis]